MVSSRDALACKVLSAHATSSAAPQQSSHERRMATLQAEFERLEQENVGKRDWTLMGESGARARPQNSLLEEHLEFESAGKAKPIVTEEVTKGLEDLIRSRILEGRFDDVVRRRHIEATPFLPSRLLELSDAKSSKSLAQLYEDDYSAAREQAEGQKARTPAADAKLQKEHEEIDAIFNEVCNKLDALSNAHYTPKAVSIASRVFSLSSIAYALFPHTAQSYDPDHLQRAHDQHGECAAVHFLSRHDARPRGDLRRGSSRRRARGRAQRAHARGGTAPAPPPAQGEARAQRPHRVDAQGPRDQR